MTEAVQIRTEYARSIDDAEKYKAIETLKDLGLLIPVSELENYHGRVGSPDADAEWIVDPSFANGFNDSGNFNVNNRPTLYTSDKQTAEDFGDSRANIPLVYNGYLFDIIDAYTPEQNLARLARQNDFLKKLWQDNVASGRQNQDASAPEVWTMEELLKHRSFVEIAHLKETLGSDHYQQFKQANAEHIFTEVHPIVSDDIDATVIDFSFDDTKLSEEDQKRYQNALRALVIPATAGSPIDFSHRDAIDPFVATMRKSGKARISKSEVSDLAQEAGVDEDIALHMAGAFNARLMALARPSALVSLLLENPKDLVDVMVPVDGEKTLLPVNLEYVQKYLREAHIIGVRQKISSATLDRSIMSTSFFDLEKIYTKKSLEARRTELAQQMGGLATALHEKALVQNSVLSNLLSNAYVKPAQLVEGAKTVEGYKQLLESDAGNWEGFTLGEHTETVLRNFDENYADSLPVELLAPMRLAILIHDLGKPMAVANGEKHKQEEYNVSQAEDFLNKIGAYDELKDLLLAVIGKGHNLAFQIDIRKSGESAQQQFNALALESTRKYLGTEHVEEEYLTGFTQMCRILQICDGGAYTSMAITNRGKGKGYYRNAPSFNDSFAQPVGLGRRAIRLRKDGEAPAANNQTPEYSRATSRLHINRSGAGRIVPDLTK